MSLTPRRSPSGPGPKLAFILANSGHAPRPLGPDAAQNWPFLGQFWAQNWPKSARKGTFDTKNWSNFGLNWPILTKISPDGLIVTPKFGQILA